MYGSRAKGLEHPDSDFDIAIAFKNFALSPLARYTRPFEQALEWALALALPERMLSIVDINSVPIYLAYNIVQYGKIIYSADTARAFIEEARIFSQFEPQLIEEKHSAEYGLSKYLKAAKDHSNTYKTELDELRTDLLADNFAARDYRASERLLQVYVELS